MKSPEEVRAQLARQWQSADLRERRLLSPDWPLTVPIGKPRDGDLLRRLGQVRAHIAAWREVSHGRVGTVRWQEVHYRSVSEAVRIPVAWELRSPSEWIAAAANREVSREFETLSRLVAAAHPRFHPLLVRQRHLLRKPEAEVMRACEVACRLEPGCARGAPLRSLSLGPSESRAALDSKFFERNRGLLTKLLDLRFGGLVRELGLEAFLDALPEDDHWLLVADLGGASLPFKQLRVRDKELATTPLQAERVVIVENERCVHHLPKLRGAVGILGAGLNLSWLSAPWLADKRLAYWGDLDTWGLTMLARARLQQPILTSLLMTSGVYDQYHPNAVPEPTSAGREPPEGLTGPERALYLRLLKEERGRLEQEFLPKTHVEEAILEWA